MTKTTDSTIRSATTKTKKETAMKFTRHHSIVHSEKVLAEVKKLAPANCPDEIDIKLWGNSREQGFCLTNIHSVTVWFAEARAWEATVICWSEEHVHRFFADAPTDQDWEERRVYVDWSDKNHLVKAAKIVMNLLVAGRPGFTPKKHATATAGRVGRLMPVRRVTRKYQG